MAETSTSRPPQPAEGAHAPAAVVSPFLKWAVIIMSVLLVVGMIVVFSTIFYRAVKLSAGKSDVSGAAQTQVSPLALGLSADAKVEKMAFSGNRLALYVRTGGTRELIIVDIRKAVVVRRLRLDAK